MNIVEKIIDLLEKDLGYKLPQKDVVIAGQSVAEAYLRIINHPVKTRIKDVDAFSMQVNNFKGFYDPKKDFLENTKFLIKRGGQKFVFRNTEASFGMVNIVNTKTIIKNIAENNRLNMIITDYKTQDELDNCPYVKHVVDSFDINSVQIGIDMSTKTLYKTKHFDNFIETRQIEITNFCSPIPSIARMIEKQIAYENSYFNEDYEVKLAIYKMFFLKKNDNYYYQTGVALTPKRYNSFSEKTKKILNKYFRLEKKKCESYYESFDLYYFHLKDEVLDPCIKSRIIEMKEFMNRESVDYKTNITREFLVKTLSKGFYQNVIDRVGKKMNNTMWLAYIYEGDIFKEKVNDVKIINEQIDFSVSMILQGYSISEIANFIRKLEKKDATHIIGLCESNQINDTKIIDKDLDTLIKEQEEKDKKEGKIYHFTLNMSEFNTEDYVVEQIKSNNKLMALGQQMKHCVGGYWNYVKNGTSLIFDVYEKKNKINRWTLELRAEYKHSDNYYRSYREYNDKYSDELFMNNNYYDNEDFLEERPDNIEEKNKDNLYLNLLDDKYNYLPKKDVKYKKTQLYGKRNKKAPEEVHKFCNKLKDYVNKQLSEDHIKRMTGKIRTVDIYYALAGDDGSQVQLYTKEHVNQEDFLRECKHFYKVNFEKDFPETNAEVKKIYWRSIPAPQDSVVCDRQFVESEPSQGAFKITLLDAWLDR